MTGQLQLRIREGAVGEGLQGGGEGCEDGERVRVGMDRAGGDD